MANYRINIESCKPSVKEKKVKKKVDKVKFCTKDNTVYTLIGTGAFTDAPDPITIGPNNCAGPYTVAGTAGSFTYTLAGASCPKVKGKHVFNPPVIIIDVS